MLLAITVMYDTINNQQYNDDDVNNINNVSTEIGRTWLY